MSMSNVKKVLTSKEMTNIENKIEKSHSKINGAI